MIDNLFSPKNLRWIVVVGFLFCFAGSFEFAGASLPRKPADPGDPIGPMAEQMGGITRDIGEMQTGQPVQTKQKAVLASLDDLIAQLQKQTSGTGGGKNPNPTKPMQRSTLAKGPGGQGPLHDAAAGTRVWGQLPPKEREQILQSQTEGFPPGYEAVLSSYYSQLAHGEAGAEPAISPQGPTTQPVAP